MSGMQSATIASKILLEVGVSPHMTKQKSATRMECAKASSSSNLLCVLMWMDARGTLCNPSALLRSQPDHCAAFGLLWAAKNTEIS
jgi:hypothetical protein